MCGGATMFGEIRSLLKRPPSPQGWESLCAHISDLGFEQVSQIMPYVLDHLKEWPDALRVAPLRWRDGLVRGATLPFAPMVRVLDAGAMDLRNEDMLTFSRSTVVPHLRALSLRGNAISWRGLKILVEQGTLKGLVALNLAGTLPGGQGLELLADHMASGGLPALEQLSLAHTRLTMPLVLPLLEANTRRTLQALGLAHNGLQDGGMLTWFEAKSLPPMPLIDLAGNPITGRAFLVARRLGWTRGVGWLGVGGLGLSATGVLPLLRGQDWPMLHTLDLSSNPIAPSLQVLVGQGRAGGFSALRVLGLLETGAQVREVIALIEGLPGLQGLVLDRTLATPEAHDFAQEHGVRLLANVPDPWLVP